MPSTFPLPIDGVARAEHRPSFRSTVDATTLARFAPDAVNRKARNRGGLASQGLLPLPGLDIQTEVGLPWSLCGLILASDLPGLWECSEGEKSYRRIGVEKGKYPGSVPSPDELISGGYE